MTDWRAEASKVFHLNRYEKESTVGIYRILRLIDRFLGERTEGISRSVKWPSEAPHDECHRDGCLKCGAADGYNEGRKDCIRAFAEADPKEASQHDWRPKLAAVIEATHDSDLFYAQEYITDFVETIIGETAETGLPDEESTKRHKAIIRLAKSPVGEHFHTGTEHRGCSACIALEINERLDRVAEVIEIREREIRRDITGA